MATPGQLNHFVMLPRGKEHYLRPQRDFNHRIPDFPRVSVPTPLRYEEKHGHYRLHECLNLRHLDSRKRHGLLKSPPERDTNSDGCDVA